jgi:hypothetical protein
MARNPAALPRADAHTNRALARVPRRLRGRPIVAAALQRHAARWTRRVACPARYGALAGPVLPARRSAGPPGRSGDGRGLALGGRPVRELPCHHAAAPSPGELVTGEACGLCVARPPELSHPAPRDPSTVRTGSPATGSASSRPRAGTGVPPLRVLIHPRPGLEEAGRPWCRGLTRPPALRGASRTSIQSPRRAARPIPPPGTGEDPMPGIRGPVSHRSGLRVREPGTPALTRSAAACASPRPSNTAGRGAERTGTAVRQP